MRITARQLGRIEAACYGLTEFTKNNSVATTLVNTIREQLDEVLADFCSRQSALPNEADLCGDHTIAEAMPELAEEVRNYGKNLIANGGTIQEVTGAVLKEFGLFRVEFAELLGVNHQRLSEALQGNPRPMYKAKFAEFFGE